MIDLFTRVMYLAFIPPTFCSMKAAAYDCSHGLWCLLVHLHTSDTTTSFCSSAITTEQITYTRLSGSYMLPYFYLATKFQKK